MIDRRPEGRAVLRGQVVESEDLLLRWDDPAAQWGLGVFETIAVRDGAPRHLDLHLRRLHDAAQRLGVPSPSNAELTRAAGLIADDAAGEQRWLRIVVSRSGSWAVFGGRSDPRDAGKPISAVVLPWRRHRLDPTVGIKSVGYAAALLGLEEARRRGADEGIWLNDRGHAIGACAANIFIVRGRAVVTPSLRDGARDGVLRELALGALRELGLSARESKVRIATLRAADEVFLTSSLRGVRPVVSIDGRAVRGGGTGPVTRRLDERLKIIDTPHATSKNP